MLMADAPVGTGGSAASLELLDMRMFRTDRQKKSSCFGAELLMWLRLQV